MKAKAGLLLIATLLAGATTLFLRTPSPSALTARSQPEETSCPRSDDFSVRLHQRIIPGRISAMHSLQRESISESERLTLEIQAALASTNLEVREFALTDLLSRLVSVDA